MTAQQSASSGTPPPAWTRRPASLASAVTAELVQRIVRGEHMPGTLLPTEHALCDTFSVSRPVVREAIKMLQEKGLVQVRRGAGTMITQPSIWNILDETVLAASVAEDKDLDILDDLVVTRRLLESDMANVAARQASDDDIDQLRTLVDEMEEVADDHLAYRQRDNAFHDVIMQASGNRLARAVVRALQSQAINTELYVGQPDPAMRMESNRGHRRIYERIAARDPDGAAEAMFTHITKAWLARRSGSGDPTRLER